MYVPTTLNPNSVSVFKIVKIDDSEREAIQAALVQLRDDDAKSNGTKPNSLTILGIGPSNDILFVYENKE